MSEIEYSIDTITIGGEEVEVIRKHDADGTIWSVPADPSNSDFQEYLKSITVTE